MTLLQVEGLCKSFPGRRARWHLKREGTRAVDDVSLDVNDGETVGLIGESGAGKSTCARLIARLIEADAGSVSFDGMNLLGLSREEMGAARERMAMVFQDPYSSFDPRVSIGASVGEPLLLHRRITKDERNRQVAMLLERVGLSSWYMRRKPRELSGGQLQRAAIARALTTSPKLIICDEPVAALDVLVRAQTLNLMMDLQAEFGIAYLFITHDLALLRMLADRVVVMRYGKVVDRGPIGHMYSDAAHPYTKELLAAIPSVTPTRRRRVDAALTTEGAAEQF